MRVVPARDPEVAAALREYERAVEEADARGLVDRSCWAYVIELEDAAGNPGDAELPWLYVGQTARTPEERFAQHRSGYKASKCVKQYGVRLRPGLYAGQPVLRTRAESEAYERYLFERLRAAGRAVKGGT